LVSALYLLLPQDAAEAAVPEAFEAFDEHVPAPTAAAAPAATARTANTGVGSNMQTNTAKRGMRGGYLRSSSMMTCVFVAVGAGCPAYGVLTHSSTWVCSVANPCQRLLNMLLALLGCQLQAVDRS
jgi:hypothetical protein